MTAHAHSSAPLMLSVSGCRGILGASLTPETIARFIGALAHWLHEGGVGARPTVVLGCDGRAGSAVLRTVAGGCLAAAGFRVIDLGVAMTPTMGVMVVHHGADAGLTLTASHNPAQWNGIKIISREGAAPDAAAAAGIIERFRGGHQRYVAAEAFGSIETDASAASVHVDRVLAALAEVGDVDRIRAKRYTVVVDSVNASGAEGARLLLDALGCRLIHLHADGSGRFPHVPEPTAENLSGMAAQVASLGADVGFAQDPDADRLAILDERGRYIGEEYTLALAAKAVLASKKLAAHGAVVAANLSTSRMIDDVSAGLGARVARSAVGEANVVSTMKRERAILGGEGNGGVIWPRVTLIRDSLGAMALTLELMAREGRLLSEIAADIPAYAIEKRKVDLKPGLTEQALAAARGLVPGANLDTQDGVRLDFPAPSGKGQAWLHVRASNTEPILRLIAEAPTADDARAILDRASKGIGGA